MHPNYSFIQSAGTLLEQAAGCRFFIVYMDIRDFQSINQYYGTDGGDRLLSSLANYMDDTACICLYERVFADCFLAILKIPDQDTYLTWHWHIEQFLVRERASYPACLLKIACGICPVTQGNIIQAIEGANMARKEARLNGAWAPLLYSDKMKAGADSKHHLELELRAALNERQFCFFLQPQVNLLTGEIVGAEALARRINRNGELFYPNQFLPHMESSGAVLELDLIIFQQVCAYLSDRMKKNLPVVRTSVNLSRLHTYNPDTAKRLDTIAQEFKIPPKLLEFELTETILLEEFSGTKYLTEQLRAYGYSVSIDDFGSGYAGINIWRELDFDCLKLDRQFLSDDAKMKDKNEVLVPNLIDIGRRLNIQVICEGVMTKEQCGYLLALGCFIGQGFYFSVPVSPDDFYKHYQEQSGHYPLSMIHPETKTEPEIPSDIDHDRKNFLLIAACACMPGVMFALLTVVHELTDGMPLPSIILALAVIAIPLVICIAIIPRYLKSLEQHYSEEQRYFLLERFSDTALFEYDCRSDTLRFTPNATRLFRLTSLVRHPFRTCLDQQNIYSEDLPVLHEFLKDIPGHENTTLRIRLKHPTGDSYIWCLVQFRFIRKHNVLASIVGKITDIDRQSPQESSRRE